MNRQDVEPHLKATILKLKKYLLLACCSWVVAMTLTCDIDHGLVPLHSKIGGRVFWTGNPPERTDEVRVAVVKDFPPRTITELLFSEQISYTQDTVSWEIFVPPGEYAAVAVIWKEKYNSWNLSDVVGLYGASFLNDLLIPNLQPVIVEDEKTILDSLDIVANLNRVNRDAKIEGTITFEGSWPENTGVIGIGAFSKIPAPDNLVEYFLNNLALDYSAPIFVDQIDYLLRVRSADPIPYISVLWIDDNYDLTSIVDLGFYPDPVNPSLPGTVVVDSAATLSDIDFTIRFME